MSQPVRILILAAVKLEAAALARVLGLKPDGPGQWIFGDVQLALIGMNACALHSCAPPRAGVIIAGIAGGLMPGLSAGEVILDSSSTPLPSVPCRPGEIFTAPHVVGSVAEKARQFAATGALAVDMENGIVRAWAMENKIAYCGVRGISDTADETLDPAILGLVDKMGNVRRGAVARLLITRPTLIPSLQKLGANSKKAAEAAAQTVRLILASGWPKV